jgi:ATP-dependent RNA helicase RhlE
MSFTQLGLSENLLSALEKQNFETPYLIQQIAIPEILKGKDVLLQQDRGKQQPIYYLFYKNFKH